ncbi:MAG TPA: 3-dehydroquinate synthase [Actinomycetota bacterium]|nr:3-dehydroquinate synthase [Actinomycetota bacterium]
MIVIVGFMGAGKSTVGRLLADELGTNFIDADDEVERTAGVSIKEIFETWGEQGFRQFERGAVANALKRGAGVVAVGGGALGDPGTRDLLKSNPDVKVVYLKVGFDAALRRVGGDTDRPMLAAADPKTLYEERKTHYEDVATIQVDTDDRSAKEIARQVAAVLATASDPERDIPLRRILVTTPSASYEVVVGSGIVGRVAGLIPGIERAEQAFFITHPELTDIADSCAKSLDEAGLRIHTLKAPSGEPTKSLATAGRLSEELADLTAHRNDLVVAVGGGVITDLAGFVASTFNRGMPVVHVATTVLAQVDAAIGGKTGVNLPQGKNLVGTFHQPRLVVCDVAVLETLPIPELRAGLAEVAKYGFISDPELLDVLESKAGDLLKCEPHLLADVVARSVEIKAAVVSADERETGRREVLNYGHTFGHAIEHAVGYEGIRHGEAIAIGMMAAAYLAHGLGRIDDGVVAAHRRVLQALELPVTASLDYDTLHEAWLRDKKYRRGVRFVLLGEMGRAEHGITAPKETIEEALKRLSV